MKSAFASIIVAGRHLAIWTAALASFELTATLRRDTPILWPWTVEGFVGTLAFFAFFFVNWALGLFGALMGWQTGKRYGWASAGATAGAIGFWIGTLPLWSLAIRGLWTALLSGLPLPLLLAWAMARWGVPAIHRLMRPSRERYRNFTRWFAERLQVRRPRATSWLPNLDLRGVIVGVIAGLIADVLALTGVFDYSEAVSLSSRVRLRNEALISPWGVAEWARLTNLQTRGFRPLRRPQAVLVDLDDASIAQIITGSSEPRLQRAVLSQLDRWGVRRVVLPVSRTRPLAATEGWMAPRPELDEAAYRRLVEDLPLLIDAVRRFERVTLCVLPDGLLPFRGPSARAMGRQSLPTVVAPELFAELLQSGRSVGSADLDFYHIRQLPRLEPVDSDGRLAVPHLLTQRPRPSRPPPAAGRARRFGAATDAGPSRRPGNPTAAGPSGRLGAVAERLRPARRVGPAEFPTSGMLVNVFGSAPGALFPHVSYSNVLQKQPIYDRHSHRWVRPEEFFRGRIVFLDTLRQPLYDTPVGQFTTTELLAMATDNLQTGNLLLPPSRLLQLVLMLIAAGLVGSLSMRRSPLRAALRLIIVAGAYVVVAVGLFMLPGLWIPIVSVLFAAALSYLLVAQLVYSADERELVSQRSERMRLDQEMAISREIQMSLLPESPAVLGDGAAGEFHHPLATLARDTEITEKSGKFETVKSSPSFSVSSVSLAKRVVKTSPSPLAEGHFFAEYGQFVIAGRSEPAREVGGDFFDVFTVVEDRVGVVLGDVAGKGVPGALYMAVTTTLLQAYARLLCEPDEVLTRANEELYPKMRGSARGKRRSVTFVSAFYGVLDPVSGRLRCASAGQIPPIVVQPDGTAAYLPLRGVPLGAFPTARYEPHEVDLEPGSVLVLASDGFVEAPLKEGPAAGEALGYDRFRDLVARHGQTDASACADAIFAEFRRLMGDDEERDDLTLLVIARSP